VHRKYDGTRHDGTCRIPAGTDLPER
jgi:hypothetical protein